MNSSNIKQLEQFFTLCHKDWNVFASDVLEANLDPEQQEILSSIQFHKKVSVASGTARGKDYVAAAAALCHLYLSPRYGEKGELVEGAKTFLTAPTERQILNIMMPEIARFFDKMNRNGFGQILGGKLTTAGIKFESKEHFLSGFKADDHSQESWTGLHSPNIAFFITEASGISETVFNSIEGNLQANSKLVLIFNRNHSVGYAAASQRSPEFKSHRLSSLTAPNVIQNEIVIQGQVDREWIQGRVREWCKRINPEEYLEHEGDFLWKDEFGIEAYYRPNDLFRIKVLALEPKVSEDVLVPGEWIEAANKRHKEFTGDIVNRSLRLGVDVAGMGTDSTIFCHRYGNYVEKLEAFQSNGEMRHMEIVGKIANKMKLHRETIAFLDTIGEGAGVFDRLKEIVEARSLRNNAGQVLIERHQIHSVKASANPEWEGKPLTDLTKQHEFLNMRAYLYWCIRDWLNPANKRDAMLPQDPELFQELTQTKWKFRSDGKIQIEAKDEIKKRIKRSPDKADALAISFYPAKDYDQMIRDQEQSRKALKRIRGLFR